MLFIPCLEVSNLSDLQKRAIHLGTPESHTLQKLKRADLARSGFLPLAQPWWMEVFVPEGTRMPCHTPWGRHGHISMLGACRTYHLAVGPKHVFVRNTNPVPNKPHLDLPPAGLPLENKELDVNARLTQIIRPKPSFRKPTHLIKSLKP